MTYLSVTNFWKYQDRNAWKKTKTHPPWFKFYVHRDQDIDHLPVAARLLFIELLAVATRYRNVLEADPNWIRMETRIELELITENLPLLLKGGWLRETKTARRGTEDGTELGAQLGVQDVDVDVDEEKILSLTKQEREAMKTPEESMRTITTLIKNGAIRDQVDFDVELRSGDHQLNDEMLDELRAQLESPNGSKPATVSSDDDIPF